MTTYSTKTKLLNFPFVILFALFAFFSMTTLHADTTGDQQKEENLKQTYHAAMLAGTKGPTKISLRDQGTLDLPENYIFIPRKEAVDFMSALGNESSSSFIGLVLPTDNNHWIISIDYIDSGYIKDGDAKEWKADALLDSLKKGTEEDNKQRKANGFPTLELNGWVQEPTYNATQHKLIWSVNGTDSDGFKNVNYNTFALGREGYFNLVLLTSNDEIDSSKADANKILTAVTFNQGKRYDDFVSGKDRIAEYGLAALVTGIVAKKLGLIALAGVFFIKIWKFLIVVCLLMYSRIKKLFARNSA